MVNDSAAPSPDEKRCCACPSNSENCLRQIEWMKNCPLRAELAVLPGYATEVYAANAMGKAITCSSTEVRRR